MDLETIRQISSKLECYLHLLLANTHYDRRGSSWYQRRQSEGLGGDSLWIPEYNLITSNTASSLVLVISMRDRGLWLIFIVNQLKRLMGSRGDMEHIQVASSGQLKFRLFHRSKPIWKLSTGGYGPTKNPMTMYVDHSRFKLEQWEFCLST